MLNDKCTTLSVYPLQPNPPHPAVKKDHRLGLEPNLLQAEIKYLHESSINYINIYVDNNNNINNF